MEGFSEALRIASLVVYSTLGVTLLRRWRRGASQPDAWAAATLLLLAALALVGVVTSPAQRFQLWFTKLLVVGIALFPYLLVRFAASITPLSRWAETLAGSVTVALVVWSLTMTAFPAPGEPRSPTYQALVFGFLAQWVGLLSFVGARLWRAGKGLPTAARRRMRILAVATLLMSMAIVASASRNSAEIGPASLAIQVLSLGAASFFFLGLAPPRWLRSLWRRREEGSLGRAVTAMMRATTRDEVAQLVVPGAATILGAPSAAMFDARGRLLASYGESGNGSGAGQIHEVVLRHGRLVVRTSPYVSFFGSEELDELETLAQLGTVAIERCDRIEREREFISNAAHELRTPMTTVYGMSMTLAEHRETMDDAVRDEMIQALVRQSTRAKLLVDDLLDLARIGPEGEQVELVPVDVRLAIEQALAAAPPPDGPRPEIHVETDLIVAADAAALERILVNLLTNAYAYGGGAIRIQGRRRDGQVTLEVSDDGPGVAETLSATLFEPFSRGAPEKSRGSGLGLTICRRLANAMGGEITYQRDGRTRFLVELRAP